MGHRAADKSWCPAGGRCLGVAGRCVTVSVRTTMLFLIGKEVHPTLMVPCNIISHINKIINAHPIDTHVLVHNIWGGSGGSVEQ
jgi:hypothetical protein